MNQKLHQDLPFSKKFLIKHKCLKIILILKKLLTKLNSKFINLNYIYYNYREK